jgi:hypothetical protein
MLTTRELLEIIELAKLSTIQRISCIDGYYIIGGELPERYEFAKFDTKWDASYAFELLKHGEEIVSELLRLREQEKIVRNYLKACKMLDDEWSSIPSAPEKEE